METENKDTQVYKFQDVEYTGLAAVVAKWAENPSTSTPNDVTLSNGRIRHFLTKRHNSDSKTRHLCVIDLDIKGVKVGDVIHKPSVAVQFQTPLGNLPDEKALKSFCKATHTTPYEVHYNDLGSKLKSPAEIAAERQAVKDSFSNEELLALLKERGLAS